MKLKDPVTRTQIIVEIIMVSIFGLGIIGYVLFSN